MNFRPPVRLHSEATVGQRRFITLKLGSFSSEKPLEIVISLTGRDYTRNVVISLLASEERFNDKH